VGRPSGTCRSDWIRRSRSTSSSGRDWTSWPSSTSPGRWTAPLTRTTTTNTGAGASADDEDDAATKLDAATQSLCALTEQLHAEDRLGVVLYNHRAHVAKPLRDDVGTTDMPAIRRHIREIAAGGSTNLADGFEAAVDMLVDGTPSPDVERRVVFMTDMMPNTGATGTVNSRSCSRTRPQRASTRRSSAWGWTRTRSWRTSCRAFAERTTTSSTRPRSFERRLGEEFDYMVTPLVYDLNLDVDADGYEIEAVHGSPSADAATDRLMHVGTLFPSAKQDGEARGGVVLVRRQGDELGRRSRPGRLVDGAGRWRVHRTRHRRRSQRVRDVRTRRRPEGGRAGWYARELRTWAADLHDRADAATGVDDWLLPDQRGQHERESVPLVVPDRYTERFDQLRSYLADEMEAVDDESMQQEVELPETLCQQAPATPHEVSD